MESSLYLTVRRLAAEVGFDACGIAPVHRLDAFAEQLDHWLSHGYQAEMHYMEDHRAMRADPSLLLPGAKSVVSVLLGYKPSQTLPHPPLVAQYAYGEDYHSLVKRMLFQLLAAIREQYPAFEARPFVDTAPISDKCWAAEAGLGWIGRNTLLVNPTLGSYCFIGELVSTAEFDCYDKPMANGCGDCRRCLDACPNHALEVRDPQHSDITVLNAANCTSYNTIENRKPQLPDGLNRCGYAFGCDICQLACPFNQSAPARVALTDDRLHELESLASADESAFKRATRHSAINRIKYPQWQRNLQ